MGFNPFSFAAAAIGMSAADSAATDQIESIGRQRSQLGERISSRQSQLRQEVNVFDRKSNQAYGDTVSSFAKAGVDISGSPLIVMADQKNEFQKTMNNIKRSGETDLRLLSMGMDALASQEDAIKNNKNLAFLGGVLSMGGSLMSVGSKGES